MWRDVAADDLWDGEMKGCAGVLLVAVDGEIHAYADRCAHLGIALSEGKLEGCVLTCSAHHYQYDAKSGAGVNPRSIALERYPVRRENGRILVDVPGLLEKRRA
jgi:toluene monooxygenase system ferredoxin subunit